MTLPTSFLDVIDDLACAFDADGALVGYNRSTVTVTGYSGAELATMSAADFFEGDDRDRIRGAVATAVEGDEATVEAVLVTADGERIPHEFEFHSMPENDDEVATVAAIGRDVTGRTQGERERPDLLDRMADAFFAVDTEWRITYANAAGTDVLTEAMGEAPVEGVEGHHLWEAIPDAVETAFYDRYREAMTTQEPVSFEEYYGPLDTWFDVRAYPSETGLSVYFRDVSDLRRQREFLETREWVLHEMYEIIADRERPFEGQVKALLELGREELDTAYGTLSRISGDDYYFEVVDAEDDSVRAGDLVPLSVTNCELAVATEETLVFGDIDRDAPAETDRAGYTDWGISCYLGGPVYVDDEVYGTFCFYDTQARDGQFSDWEVTLVDLMSRWVSYELQHREAQDRLRRQNERLDRFASLVSHDLRNPLTVVDASLELAEETGDLDQLADARHAVDRMNALIDDLLLFSRSGAVIDGVEDLDLASVVRECWKTVATEGATLRVDTGRSVRADGGRLRQLLENLVGNAVEHGGESVTVTVGDLPDGFFVEDDGPGVPEGDRESVFESGYTTGPEGTGLGLAIVEEIAVAHDWDLRLTAGSSGGARFEFTGMDDP